MPARSSNFNRSSQKDSRFFSLKPPKADQKALAARLQKDPTFVMVALEKFPKNWTFNTKFNKDQDTWQCTCNLGDVHQDGKDCLLIGRGANPLRAITMIVYWLESTPMETLFPPEDNDGDDFVF